MPRETIDKKRFLNSIVFGSALMLIALTGLLATNGQTGFTKIVSTAFIQVLTRSKAPTPVDVNKGLAVSAHPIYRQDLQRTGRSPYKGAKDPNLLWKINIKTEFLEYSSPTVDSNGNLYFAGSEGKLFAVDSNGKRLWTFKAEGMFSSPPTIGHDNTLYIGDLDNFFYAIGPDGVLKWKVPVKEGVNSSPCVTGTKTIYVGTGNNSLLALNLDGSKKWEFQREKEKPVKTMMGELPPPVIFEMSSPSVGQDGTIYIGSTDKGFFAVRDTVNPSGKIWVLKWSLLAYGPIRNAPAIGKDKTIYLVTCSGSWNPDYYKLTSISSNGKEKRNILSASPGYEISQPALGNDGTIYCSVFRWVDKNSMLLAVNPSGGAKWKFNFDGVAMAPVVDAEGTIYLSTHNGFVYAINPDGTKKWSYDSHHPILSPPVIDRGRIYFATTDGFIFALGDNDF